MVDTCPLWVSNPIYTIMSLQQIDFSKVLNDEQVYDHMMANYDQLGKDWINHQWRWMNAVYQAFKDHYKYMIIISLVEKTLQFYDQMNIKLSYEQYYSKNFLQIDKFSITELCEKLQLPKETVRRKVLELEKEGVIARFKKKIIIDNKAFPIIKPENQIRLSSKYIYLVSIALNKDKIYTKKLNPKMLTSFVDGSKTMVEMAALANFLDFQIDIDGMHGIEATYENINQYYIPKKDGGLLDNSQVVDFAFGIAPGVFAVVYSEDDYVNYEMEYLKTVSYTHLTLPTKRIV